MSGDNDAPVNPPKMPAWAIRHLMEKRKALIIELCDIERLLGLPRSIPARHKERKEKVESGNIDL